MEFFKKNNKIISIILLTLIFYVRCDHGIVRGYAVVLNLIADALGFIYCIILTKQDFESTRKSLCNPAILWLVLFQFIQFIYGHFKLFIDGDIYSMRYVVLTIMPALICYEILWHNKSQIIEIWAIVGTIIIIATMITSMNYDIVWTYLKDGIFGRLGETPGGSDIDTGNLYLIMTIPLLYEIIILKKVKPYIVQAVIGIVGIILTGSKSSFIPMILVIAIMVLATAKDKKTVKRNILILLIVAIIGMAAIFLVPMLYTILGRRIVEVFAALNSSEFDLHTSTGQRLAVIDAFKKHFWESPIFGHGFYAFVQMPYSQIEEYRLASGEIAYRNIQTHMNLLEILFSFGIFGTIVYYWYPIKQFIDVLKSKTYVTKVIGLSLLISIFFMNLGLEMFYKYMTPYFIYLLVYCFLNMNDNSCEGK